MSETIKALYVKPGEYPEIIEIENTLEAKQRAVGGCIEMAMPFEDDVALIFNESGKLERLPLNRALYYEGEVYDVVAGNFLVVGAPPMSEDFTSLSQELLLKYEKQFHHPEMFYMSEDRELGVVSYNPREESERSELTVTIGETYFFYSYSMDMAGRFTVYEDEGQHNLEISAFNREYPWWDVWYDSLDSLETDLIDNLGLFYVSQSYPAIQCLKSAKVEEQESLISSGAFKKMDGSQRVSFVDPGQSRDVTER